MSSNLEAPAATEREGGEAPADTPPASAPADARRQRFRAAVSQLATHSTSEDLVRWMLVPASISVVLGFGAMALGWVGAARTAREIEQIPYLISGGLIGLALVVLGGLLLASTFWVAVLRKLHQEAETGSRAELEELRARVAELEARPVAAPRARRTAAAQGGPASNGAARSRTPRSRSS